MLLILTCMGLYSVIICDLVIWLCGVCEAHSTVDGPLRGL